MFTIMTFTDEWKERGTYDNITVARWILENQIMNPHSCVIDNTTGEVLLEK